MKCRSCSEEIPDDSEFCNKCGARQAEPAAPAIRIATPAAGAVTLCETSLRFDSVEGIISSKANVYFAATDPADEADETIAASPMFKIPEPCVFHTMSESSSQGQRISVSAHRLDEFTQIAKPVFAELEQMLTGSGWEWAGQMESWWRQRYRRSST